LEPAYDLMHQMKKANVKPTETLQQVVQDVLQRRSFMTNQLFRKNVPLSEAIDNECRRRGIRL
jgi:hypothetical protein